MKTPGQMRNSCLMPTHDMPDEKMKQTSAPTELQSNLTAPRNRSAAQTGRSRQRQAIVAFFLFTARDNDGSLKAAGHWFSMEKPSKLAAASFTIGHDWSASAANSKRIPSATRKIDNLLETSQRHAGPIQFSPIHFWPGERKQL